MRPLRGQRRHTRALREGGVFELPPQGVRERPFHLATADATGAEQERPQRPAGGHRRGVQVESRKVDAEDLRILPEEQLGGSEGVQQGGRQHLPQPNSRSGGEGLLSGHEFVRPLRCEGVE